MQALLSMADNILFSINSLIYNILTIVTKNTLIYSFIIIYVKSQKSTKTNIFYTILYIFLSILLNVFVSKVYIKLYKKHQKYIKDKIAIYIRDMYIHALIDKYLTQKPMEDIYEIFNSFVEYINDYWKLYEMHAEIIVASIVIAIAYSSTDVNKILGTTAAIIIVILFIIEYLLLDHFNDLHEYFITAILNEKLLLIFLIYIPYAFVNNTNIRKDLPADKNNIYGSLLAIFIILFWKISFNNFLTEYAKKIDLTHKIKKFIIDEQKQPPNEINELSPNHNHFIYLIHDSNEPISIIDYFRLTNPNINKSQIIKALNKLSILPELHKRLKTNMNDQSLTDEQKIKISIARSLVIPPNYTVIYFKDDQIVSKYTKIITHRKLPIIGNPHALS